jgi:hypothetical protein
LHHEDRLSQRSVRLLFVLLASTSACSSSGGSSAASGGSGGAPSGSGGSGGNPGGLLPYKPCQPGSRVGGFAVQLMPAMADASPPAAAYTQVNGGVLDRVDPTTLWQTTDSDGDCKLVVGSSPACNPACGTGQVCGGQNQCSPEPVSRSVGTVVITGLSAPVSLMPLASYKVVYYAALPASAKYPPFSPGDPVALSADGGAVGAFELGGRGIEPLVFPGTGLSISAGQPLAINWTAPAPGGSSRVLIALDIAHHGGVAARVECDVADTGSATIPASLLDKLVARGTAGFPTVSLTRRTLDSTSIAPGCVDFAVASTVERDVQVAGVQSCNDSKPCPSGRTCGADQKCK